ncbi:hypothetical protein, partial [Ralstonia pseudosolanacearum]|uniref:hypothetical protein n=1 Tax=Ralstonia pseudosolanacearum TaxID=1310165 RepID=UPI001FFBE19D
LNRPISPALRNPRSLACATSSANLIDQRFLNNNAKIRWRFACAGAVHVCIYKDLETFPGITNARMPVSFYEKILPTVWWQDGEVAVSMCRSRAAIRYCPSGGYCIG